MNNYLDKLIGDDELLTYICLILAIFNILLIIFFQVRMYRAILSEEYLYPNSENSRVSLLDINAGDQ